MTTITEIIAIPTDQMTASEHRLAVHVFRFETESNRLRAEIEKDGRAIAESYLAVTSFSLDRLTANRAALDIANGIFIPLLDQEVEDADAALALLHESVVRNVGYQRVSQSSSPSDRAMSAAATNAAISWLRRL